MATTQQTLNEIKTSLKEISDNQTKVLVELNRISHDLYGNGKKGLFEEFDEYKKTKAIEFKDCKETVDKHSKYFWGMGILSCFTGGVITFVATIIANKYVK